jgi:3-hydroxymyristoyl/3-hydroxydecanoyl-(acyl carrier protein) dehydratase
MLLVQGDVTPQDWYFKHHFYQDPVMPGSLGVEAAMQAMVQYARWRYAGPSGTSYRPSIRQVLGHEMVWKYRGQITPEDRQWQEVVDLTETRRDRDGVTLIGDVTLWKAGLPIYLVEGTAVRVDGV